MGAAWLVEVAYQYVRRWYTRAHVQGANRHPMLPRKGGHVRARAPFSHSNRCMKSAHSMIALAFVLLSTTLDPGGADAVRLTDQEADRHPVWSPVQEPEKEVQK